MIEKNNPNKNAYTIWITGLPCAGKTTIGEKLKEEVSKLGYGVVHLDGDDVRKGINADLGYSKEDRKENLRRVAHIAELLNKNGIIVIASFISPTNELREMIKKIIGKEKMKLVYAKCSLAECERRDIKGMYKKARKGEIPEFTGVNSPFEEPEEAIVIDTEKNDVSHCVKIIIRELNIIRKIIS